MREIAQRSESVEGEFSPGDNVATDEQVSEWIRREAWGHHACVPVAWVLKMMKVLS